MHATYKNMYKNLIKQTATNQLPFNLMRIKCADQKISISIYKINDTSYSKNIWHQNNKIIKL